MKNKTRRIAVSAIIAALYVVLTLISASIGLSSGVIQLRISEALYVLVWFTPSAIPGLFLGCMIANLVTGAVVWDIIFGSIATLLGAVGAYYLRKRKIVSLLCPVISNMIIIPLVLKYAYMAPGSVWYFSLTVGIGELIS